MPNDSDARLIRLEDEQVKQRIIIERLLTGFDEMKQSVAEIKDYMRKAFTHALATTVTLLIGGLGTLVWYGLKAALRANGN